MRESVQQYVELAEGVRGSGAGLPGQGREAGRMKYLLACWLILSAALQAESLFDPDTRALVIGVLRFQDPGFASFGAADRRDAELVELLESRGVEVTYLQDEEATLAAIQRVLPEVAAACGEDEQLIIYYTGHGGKTRDGGDIVFANYDARRGQANMLSARWMLDTVKANFGGQRVLFLADCCSSGGLADMLAREPGELEAAALMSSSANETSSDTWAFTQDVLDGLRGSPALDLDRSGSVTLDELARYTRVDMAAYFGQMAAFSTVGEFPPDLELARVTRKAAPGEGQRVLALRGGKWHLARVVRKESGRTRVRWMVIGLDTAASDEWKSPDEVRPLPTPPAYPVGARVQVLWQRQYWPAVVLEARDGLHKIHYVGYGKEWDEWVGAQRIKPGRARGRNGDDAR